MAVEIVNRPITVRVGPGAPRPIVLSRPTTTAIRDGQARRNVAVRAVRTPVQVEQAKTVRVDTIQRGLPGRDGLDGAGLLPPIPFGWGDAPRAVFTPAADGILTICRIQFTQPFDDPAASVRVGTTAAPGAAMPAEWNRPASSLEFENTPDLPMAAGEPLILTIAPAASTQGGGLLFLSFLPTE